MTTMLNLWLWLENSLFNQSIQVESAEKMKNGDKNEDAVFPWVVCYFRGVQHNTRISTSLNVFINKLYCERV